jgi:sec-independent protein translocase protein TatC
MTFWEHLDELRGSLVKMVVAVLVGAIVAFFFKEEMFRIILAPQDTQFITYRWLDQLSQALFSVSTNSTDLLQVQLINTGLAQQFMLHVKASLWTGVLLTSPYLIYLAFHFISPDLYTNDRRYALRLVGFGYILFMAGVLLSYFLIFPLIFRFLGTYQVSEVVANTVTIESYIDTLLMISIAMGLVFEIPIVSWILVRLGIIRASVMRRYRRHVIIALLIVAAIITPTSDAFTLFLVALPMWLLFEVSILIVRK